MWTTTEEAKKKKCVRDMADTCIGEQCMAWRWKEDELDPKARPAGRLPRGFCGLAGHPDTPADLLAMPF